MGMLSNKGILILPLLKLLCVVYCVSSDTDNFLESSNSDSMESENSSLAHSLLFPIPHINEVEYYTKEFGQVCNNYEKCDYRFWLTCSNGTCQCQRPKSEIYYDETRNLCVARIDTPCKRKVCLDDEGVLVKPNDVNRLYQISQTVENNIIYDVIECPPHAFCDGRFCRCEPGYFTNTENGTCLKQKEIHQVCENDVECKSVSILHCIHGICTCQPHRVYDSLIDKCVVSVSTGNCSRTSSADDNNSDCPQNARCDFTTKTCTCNKGYTITSQGNKCARGYNEVCSSYHPCADSLQCLNGVCVCKYLYHQYYSEEEKKCVSLVGGHCTAHTESSYKAIPCTKNANCTSNEYYYECTCNSGYIEDSLGKCIKSYGMPCEEKRECDAFAGLQCVDSRCACPDRLKSYDKRLKLCVGLVGSKCYAMMTKRMRRTSVRFSTGTRTLLPTPHPNTHRRLPYKTPHPNNLYTIRNNDQSYFHSASNAHDGGDDDDDEVDSYGDDVSTLCVEGASCVPNNPYYPQIYGKCLCNSFYVPLANRTCNMD